MSNFNWGLILDVIVTIYGAYILISATKMKVTGVPSSMIASPEEMNKDTDKKSFIHAILAKMFFFGGICVVYGAVNLINYYTVDLVIVNVISLLVFLGACLWFVGNLQKVRRKFLIQ